jgi:glycosyltransferase involved in cell wall biosynthesis
MGVVRSTAPPAGRPGSAIAVVLKGYPRLSETFIAEEIRGLEARGLDLRLVALRRPTDRAVHPVHREIRAPVTYLPEYLHQAPLRVLRAWWRRRRSAGYRAARTLWLADLRRDPTRNRLRRFGQALVLAAELPPAVGWLHAHFLHTPASVTRYAAVLSGLPWSASAHAKDVWTTPAWDLADKLAALRWAVTCTRANLRYLATLAADPDRIELVYHGLDRRRFPPFDASRPPRDGRDPADPVVLLSVGRAVAKKGFDVLLEALARLPPDLAWRLVHIGDGPLLPALRQQARHLGLAGRIAWQGAQPQDQVLTAYRAADLFVLACRITGDGDRDGLPNVLVEAQSQGLACIASRVSAIPELIEDARTGILVPAEDPAALAAAIHRLAIDPAARQRLGAAGLRHITGQFAAAPGLDRLAGHFRRSLAGTDRAAAA